MRRPINTVNGTYKDPNRAYSAQDALNVIPMMTEKSGTRTVSQYRQAPGLKPFCRIGQNGGEAGFVAAGAGRGLRVVDGKLYAVAGRNLWQITASGVSVNYGTIPGVGRVSMAHNQRGLGNELAIDNGQSRYVFNTQTQVLQKVTDESFPGSVKSFFIDGYIGYVEPQGRYWGHSDLSNALVYNAFDVYEAEGQPDRIVSAHVSNREVLIAGQDTIEAYVNSPSGSGEAPFVRATNTVIESGCSARDSFCSVGQFTVYLDQNRTVQVLNGYTPVPISTSVIDSALQACTKQQIANAYAFALESEGFQIYYLTVPGKFTFGYDFKNREWHRRSSTGLDWWAVTDVVQWNGRWFALDSRRGDILELRWYDYPFDVQEELVREWVTGTISADQNPIFVHELELLFGCGGQAYTTVNFPEQPLGPSMSGSAQDGSVGIAYAGFTYTTTPGDAAIARTIILSGALPPGLTWDQASATINPGTPTALGDFEVTFRTFDVNGLFYDYTDTITVTAVSFGLRSNGGSQTILQLSPDAIDWTATVDPGVGSGIVLLSANSEYVHVFESTGAGRYSENYGLAGSWQPMTGTAVSQPPRTEANAEGVWVMFPSSGSTYRRSTNGKDYSSVNASSLRSWFASCARGGTFLVGSTNGTLGASTNAGVTWAEYTLTTGLGTSDVHTVFCDSRYFYAICNGRMFRSLTAASGSWTEITPPTALTVLASSGYADGDEIVFVYVDQLYRSTDHGDNWGSAQTLPSTVSFASHSIAFNGVRLMVGLLDGITSDVNGTWTHVFNPTGQSDFYVASMTEVVSE